MKDFFLDMLCSIILGVPVVTVIFAIFNGVIGEYPTVPISLCIGIIGAQFAQIYKKSLYGE